jgi:hypothetical protein
MQIFKIPFILSLLITLVSNATVPDSSNSMLTLHLSKRKMISYNDFLERAGPFRDNYILSGSLLLQKKIGHIRSITVNGEMGLNFRVLQIGYKKAVRNIESDSSNFSAGAFMCGLQFGLSFEKKILTFRQHTLSLSVGFTGSGMVFSSNSMKYGKVYNAAGNFKADSIVLEFGNNRLFYLNPYGQLTIRSAVGKRSMVYGLRYLLATDFDQTNVSYKDFEPKYYGDYARGTFLDVYDQAELFFGLTF